MPPTLLRARFVDTDRPAPRRRGGPRRAPLPRRGPPDQMDGDVFTNLVRTVRDAGRRVSPWGPKVDLGPHLRVRGRNGVRPAVVEMKPGLYLVAELPQQAVEMGFAPALLLAPALAKTLARAFRKKGGGPEGGAGGPAALPGPGAGGRRGPLALPGPVDPDWRDEPDDDDETEGMWRGGRVRPSARIPRWLDAEDADALGLDIGCDACVRQHRRGGR